MLAYWMRYFIFLLLPLLCHNAPYSRGSGNYFEYYKMINQAELSIFELDFHNAYNTYKKAFETFEKRHLNDLHNASLCAILIGESAQAKEWIMEMISKGVSITSLNTSYFKKLPESEWNIIKQSEPILRQIYQSKVDSSYFNTLSALAAREQEFSSSQKSQTSYDSLLYEHAKVLHALISEGGIPPVPIFGRFHLPIDVIKHNFGLRNRLKFPNENEIDLETEPYKSMDFSLYDLEPLLRQSVFNGDLSPQFLGSALSHSELDSTRQLRGFTLYADLNTKTITYETVSEENLKQIDQYRQSLGLESVCDAAKKDIMVALYYNQESFPFDEHIRRDKEIGFSKKTVASLKPNSKEFDSLARASIRVMSEIKETFLKNNSFEIERKADNECITIENKYDLLKEFRISQSIVQKIILSLYE
jgi:hypothetical protein